jgi:DNA-binding transcriptional regulator YdaS (Cro superfamily)
MVASVANLLRVRHMNVSAIARALSITPSAIHQWHRVPAERVIEFERVTGIPRHELRPDLYPEAARANA